MSDQISSFLARFLQLNLYLLFVILIVRFFTSLVNGIRIAQYNREYDRQKNAREALANQYVDRDLENDLYYEIKRTFLPERKRIVQEFMGGSERWADYVDYADGGKKVLLIEMAKRGKIPRGFVTYGEYLPFTEDTLHKPGPHQIRPQLGRQMNEEFMLKVEEYLQKHGIPAVVYCNADLPDGRKNVWISVRNLQAKYGPGLTHYFTGFQFVRQYE